MVIIKINSFFWFGGDDNNNNNNTLTQNQANVATEFGHFSYPLQAQSLEFSPTNWNAYNRKNCHHQHSGYMPCS
jgi:hypothetical protein